MLTNPQKALLKRAQRAAGLPDDEYREAIATVTGMDDCRSSTDPRLTDAHLDRLMAYLEAIQNRREAAMGGGTAAPATYWQGKNPKGCTSRDRHGSAALEGAIRRLEAAMQARGKGLHTSPASRPRPAAPGPTSAPSTAPSKPWGAVPPPSRQGRPPLMSRRPRRHPPPRPMAARSTPFTADELATGTF